MFYLSFVLRHCSKRNPRWKNYHCQDLGNPKSSAGQVLENAFQLMSGRHLCQKELHKINKNFVNTQNHIWIIAKFCRPGYETIWIGCTFFHKKKNQGCNHPLDIIENLK